MRIMGVDPGLRVTGYGILDSNVGHSMVVEAGVVRTKDTQPLDVRLLSLFDGISEVLREMAPQVVVVEDLYSSYNHPKTAILMGHARGVLFLAAAKELIPVLSYTATRIKKSLTGSGRASKEQVQRSVTSFLNLARIPQPNDVADALAVAMCHANVIMRGERLLNRHSRQQEGRKESPQRR